ncbi:UNVERIFIED_CONTAM: putative mitochondrial protein [Sesamum radiatum]|uniref:Mitochondrial protein n=1 Tax=Sesamum radiatum TaxID=300843 RepID=A0AAW2TK66_SESRA
MMNEALLQSYTEEEISKAIFQMAPLESPDLMNQSSFIPGRLITDNVLIAFEINHYLHTKTWGSKGHAAIKLDSSKAYDKVELLEKILTRLGFAPRFVHLIMSCVSTVSYSFMLNGCEFGFLTPKRGIRQGDPLSPYLFLLCTEAFSALLHKAEKNGRTNGISVCRRAQRITHLLFADDTQIYCQASMEAMRCVKEILEIYAKASGSSKLSIFRIPLLWKLLLDTALPSLGAPSSAPRISYSKKPHSKFHSVMWTTPDLLCWHYSNNGCFNVKSAYFLALDISDKCSSSSIGPNSLTSRWKILWKIKVPRKIQLICWKLCLDSLPTAVNLRKRIHDSSFGCPFCQELNKDISHTFISCDFARQIWALSLLSWSVISVVYRDPTTWFHHVADHLTEQEMELFVVICWFIWWGRNKLRMESMFIPPVQIVTSAQSFLTAYQVACSIPNGSPCSNTENTWTRSPTGVVKINFDAAIFRDTFEISYGVIGRNNVGNVIAWISHRFPSLLDPEVAEGVAARAAALLTQRKEWREIIIEGDCLGLINKLKSSNVDFSTMGPIILDIKNALISCPSFAFSFTSRNNNRFAHTLAKYAGALAEGVSFSELDANMFHLSGLDTTS